MGELAIDVQWSIVAPISIAATAIGSFITWFWSRAGKAALLQQQVTDAKDHAKQSDERANTIQKAHETLLERLHEHMLADAGSFAKLEAIASEATRTALASEQRLTGALDMLAKRLDTMTQRLDEFLQRIPLMVPKP
jgi:hypothetical protein